MLPDFEAACMHRALQTLSLDPLAILGDERRLPDNLLASDARMPRPAWVGPDYRIGGVLLLGKNPGGGSPSFEGQRSAEDAAIYGALDELVHDRSLEAFRRWRDVEGCAMQSWKFWRSIAAVLDAIGCSAQEVAVGNLLPLRTRDNKVSVQEFWHAWNLDTRHLVARLQPRLIVRMTTGFPQLARLVPDGCEVLQFRRAIGDGFISSYGEQDLEVLRRRRK